jgi:hypothetical protein
MSLCILIGGIQTTQALAWDSYSKVNDFGDKQFVIENYFKSGVGPVPDKMPKSGPFKYMVVVCTGGFFEIGFFDVSKQGKFLNVGNPKSMRIKIDGKLISSNVEVNTEKGPEYIQVNNPEMLFKRLKTAKTFAVEIPVIKGFYQATFDVKNTRKYLTKFAWAGCKV